ncbi:MAG: hypothetical protein GC134_03460 [Proteobacteria bacterium]|nr:hypothetical protein [Pseudomonadota bacterium]
MGQKSLMMTKRQQVKSVLTSAVLIACAFVLPTAVYGADVSPTTEPQGIAKQIGAAWGQYVDRWNERMAPVREANKRYEEEFGKIPDLDPNSYTIEATGVRSEAWDTLGYKYIETLTRPMWIDDHRVIWGASKLVDPRWEKIDRHEGWYKTLAGWKMKWDYVTKYGKWSLLWGGGNFWTPKPEVKRDFQYENVVWMYDIRTGEKTKLNTTGDKTVNWMRPLPHFCGDGKGKFAIEEVVDNPLSKDDLVHFKVWYGTPEDVKVYNLVALAKEGAARGGPPAAFQVTPWTPMWLASSPETKMDEQFYFSVHQCGLFPVLQIYGNAVNGVRRVGPRYWAAGKGFINFLEPRDTGSLKLFDWERDNEEIPPPSGMFAYHRSLILSISDKDKYEDYVVNPLNGNLLVYLLPKDLPEEIKIPENTEQDEYKHRMKQQKIEELAGRIRLLLRKPYWLTPDNKWIPITGVAEGTPWGGAKDVADIENVSPVIRYLTQPARDGFVVGTEKDEVYLLTYQGKPYRLAKLGRNCAVRTIGPDGCHMATICREPSTIGSSHHVNDLKIVNMCAQPDHP